MSASRWSEIERVCHAALERPPESRAAFLAEACGDDDALRREVESLLAQLSRADSFIETPALEMDAQREPGPGLTNGQHVGTYQVVTWLGAGGMGEVYRAHDKELGRDVALKVLAPTLLNDPERLARFEREARVLAALNHPNVGAIYGLANAAGVRALVLELVEGETLAEKLGQVRRVGQGRQEALPLSVALPIARQIADALEAAHEKGIVHRDLKPAYERVDPKTKVDVWMQPLDGGKAVPFVASLFTEGDARFSPDGRWVGYSSDESGQFEVYVREFAPNGAGGKWLVSRGGGMGPRWREDGKELFYKASDGTVMAVDVTTVHGEFHSATPKRLFNVASDRWDVTADGTRFLVAVPVEQDSRTPFTVVLNWQASLKR
jgi:hypothetical protein